MTTAPTKDPESPIRAPLVAGAVLIFGLVLGWGLGRTEGAQEESKQADRVFARVVGVVEASQAVTRSECRAAVAESRLYYFCQRALRRGESEAACDEVLGKTK